MEAASASLTVSFTDCIRFWALWTNISVAWWRRNSGMKENGKNHFTSDDLKKTYLLWLLFTDVGATQHGGFNRGQDFELSADGWNTLTHLKQDVTSADLIPNDEVQSFHYKPSDDDELTWSRLVRIRLSVHCLATSLASRVTSSEALAMSLAHWMRARLFPLPPRTRRDISAMSRAIRLAAPMMSFPCAVQQEHGDVDCFQ